MNESWKHADGIDSIRAAARILNLECQNTQALESRDDGLSELPVELFMQESEHQASEREKVPTGAIDTGCQRMAIGSETCDGINAWLPNHLKIRKINKQYRFKGVGARSRNKWR